MGSELSTRWNPLQVLNNQERMQNIEVPTDDNDSSALSDSSLDDRPLNYELEKFTRKWFNDQPLMEFTYCCGDNGAAFEGRIIPEEVLSLILSNLDYKSLMNCRLVCLRWRNLIDSDIWRFKLEKKVYRNLMDLLDGVTTTFPVLYKVGKVKPFNRNFIKNSSGEANFKHWRGIQNGGDGWRIEKTPAGADDLPLDEDFPITSCFATSFHVCSKVQVIDLLAQGLTPIILDDLQPTIYVSELYAARYDCASTYTMSVILLNKMKKDVDSFEETKRVEQWQGREWHKVEHEFKNYGRGVRYIKFFHSGVDGQFWKGHYGSKMSRACVKLIL